MSYRQSLIRFCFTFQSRGIRDRAWPSQYLMKTLVTRQARQGACRLQNTWFMRFSLDFDSHLRHRSRPLLSRAPKLKLTLEAKEHFRGRIMFSFHSTFHVAGKSELRNVYTQNFAASNIPIVNSLWSPVIPCLFIILTLTLHSFIQLFAFIFSCAEGRSLQIIHAGEELFRCLINWQLK